MSEPFKLGFDAACPDCRLLDETCPEHRRKHLYPEQRFPETYTMEFTIPEVDPEVLGLLTGGALGGAMGTPMQPEVSIEAYIPARRRTFWEWLRRKPKHHAAMFYIPRARVTHDPREESE